MHEVAKPSKIVKIKDYLKILREEPLQSAILAALIIVFSPVIFCFVLWEVAKSRREAAAIARGAKRSDSGPK